MARQIAACARDARPCGRAGARGARLSARARRRPCSTRGWREARRRLARAAGAVAAGAPGPSSGSPITAITRRPICSGPRSRPRLGIPYVVAEASDSQRRAEGEWARHVALARAGFAAADLHLCFTDRDRQGLEPHAGPHTRFLALPPFIATADQCAPTTQPAAAAAADLRRDDAAGRQAGRATRRSARVLAASLQQDWTLTIIGDGPEREAVRQRFVGDPAVAPRLARRAAARRRWRRRWPAHDIFVWPGLGEAYGLVYLEAQAAGLPVVAFASGGVPATMRAGRDRAARAGARRGGAGGGARPAADATLPCGGAWARQPPPSSAARRHAATRPVASSRAGFRMIAARPRGRQAS